MAKKKVTLDMLAAEMRKGFGALENKIEKGFAAAADDIAHMATKHDLMATEKRLNDRIDGVRIKVDGLQNERDAEALQRRDQKIPERVTKLEEKVFGKVRA